MVVPTRGEILDIGQIVSHKTQIIELYLNGYGYTEIEQGTRHTGDSIKRYICGFSKVVLLSSQLEGGAPRCKQRGHARRRRIKMAK